MNQLFIDAFFTISHPPKGFMRALSLICLGLTVAGCRLTSDSLENPRSWYDPALGKRDNCWGYRVAVEVSDPGCRIEVNDEHVATFTNTTGELILWGYHDGKFRERQLVRVVANPVKPGQNQQVKVFKNDVERERVPKRLYFDLNLERVKATEKVDLQIR